MSKKIIPALVVSAIVVTVGALIYTAGLFMNQGLFMKPDNSKLSADQLAPTIDKTKDSPQVSNSLQGRHATYSADSVADSGYTTSVVFFFAPWCPECQAFKKSLSNGPLPEGVQVLETDYDSSTDLKKQYGVTIQSTFARVNTSGDLQKKWVGYGKDKSLTTVLENLK